MNIFCVKFLLLLLLLLLLVPFATSGSVAGSFATSGSVAGSVVGSRVGILSNFFTGNNLYLKLLRTFSLALNNNPKLFQKDVFQVLLYLFQNFLIH